MYFSPLAHNEFVASLDLKFVEDIFIKLEANAHEKTGEVKDLAGFDEKRRSKVHATVGVRVKAN